MPQLPDRVTGAVLQAIGCLGWDPVVEPGAPPPPPPSPAAGAFVRRPHGARRPGAASVPVRAGGPDPGVGRTGPGYGESICVRLLGANFTLFFGTEKIRKSISLLSLTNSACGLSKPLALGSAHPINYRCERKAKWSDALHSPTYRFLPPDPRSACPRPTCRGWGVGLAVLAFLLLAFLTRHSSPALPMSPGGGAWETHPDTLRNPRRGRRTHRFRNSIPPLRYPI